MSRFLRERAFWQELGWTREELARRPWQEVHDYEVILGIISQEEAAQARRAGAK